MTEPGATAVIDSYDPTVIDPEALLGYRRDPAPGLCHRVMWFEYGDRVDPVLRFRLFSPTRLRKAAVGTTEISIDTPSGSMGTAASDTPPSVAYSQDDDSGTTGETTNSNGVASFLDDVRDGLAGIF